MNSVLFLLESPGLGRGACQACPSLNERSDGHPLSHSTPAVPHYPVEGTKVPR